MLFVIDGAKGLCGGIKKIFTDKALIQPCQWHKRKNVVGYLPKFHWATWQSKLQQAYEKPIYEEAKAALNRLKAELRLMNESAVASLRYI